MSRKLNEDRGQAMIEFAIIATALLLLTAGLIDSGRAFFQYNAVSAAARYGARWGSVVGGTCGVRSPGIGAASSGWCTMLGTGSGPAQNPFWTQAGNQPVWTGTGTTCPASYSGASTSNSYLASNYAGSSSTTIVGAVVNHFDTSSSSTNFVQGNLTPGLVLSKTYICIQLPDRAWNSNLSEWTPWPGDVVKVYIYYPFYPASGILPATQINLMASAQYQIEGA